MPFEFLPHILSPQSWPADPWMPSWDDLRPDGLPRDESLIGDIATKLLEKPVVLVAPANTGKTFLLYLAARAVANAASQGDVEIWYGCADELSGQDSRRLVEARNWKRRYDPNPGAIRFVFVVDDCHVNEDLAGRLIQLADPPGVVVLCALRGSSEDDLPQWASDIYSEKPGPDYLPPAIG